MRKRMSEPSTARLIGCGRAVEASVVLSGLRIEVPPELRRIDPMQAILATKGKSTDLWNGIIKWKDYDFASFLDSLMDLDMALMQLRPWTNLRLLRPDKAGATR